MVGQAPEMDRLYRIIAKAASSTYPVLILGESGTVEELVARSIHYSGPLRDHPFITIDCGSLVPSLIESALFGYVKGAFTGAVLSKDGLLTMAEGGTVFLDEVGELPIDLQAKLLCALCRGRRFGPQGERGQFRSTCGFSPPRSAVTEVVVPTLWPTEATEGRPEIQEIKENPPYRPKGSW